MDKDEADRVAQAIRRMPVEWSEIPTVEFNPASNTYEVTCAYKQRHTSRDAALTQLRICTPRQWIHVLTRQ